MKTSTRLLATLGPLCTFDHARGAGILELSGTVTDSTGTDSVTPARKTARCCSVFMMLPPGNLIWTEEQTVTVSKG